MSFDAKNALNFGPSTQKHAEKLKKKKGINRIKATPNLPAKSGFPKF